MKLVEKQLRDLYKKIPEIKCKKGCSRCCGLIMLSKPEYDMIKEHRDQTEIKCPYLNDDNLCDIYEDRPFVCRMFGTMDGNTKFKLACPEGCLPAKPLTRTQEFEIRSEYQSIVYGFGTTAFCKDEETLIHLLLEEAKIDPA